MRGLHYSSDGALSENDLHELTDLLTLQLYEQFGHRAYALSRQDIAELIHPFIRDLVREDQRSLPWLVWELLQVGMEIEYQRH